MSTAKTTITVIFRGMDSSDAVRQYAEKRALKIDKHVHQATHCQFTFLVEKTDQVAQVHVVSGSFEARADARGETLYAAIDEVVDKIVQQTRKHKEKETDHSGRPHHNQE